METLGERIRDRTSGTAQQIEPGQPWGERCAEQARAYMRRVCGPDVPGDVVAAMLAEVEGGGGR